MKVFNNNKIIPMKETKKDHASSFKNLSILEAYKVQARLPIIQSSLKQYPVIKKYFDNNKEIKQISQEDKNKIKKRNLKLRTYLDQQQIRHKKIPGPGAYNINVNWIKQGKQFKDYTDRKTYLDQIFRRNQVNKSPGPGQYLEILQNHSKSASKINYKQERKKQRLFYYDQNQYIAATTPAVGQYDISKRIKTQFSHKKQNPKQNIKKYRAMSQKKLKSLSKVPDMGTYNPQQCSYFTFETAKKTKKLKNSFGFGQRFKTLPQGSGLSPHQYNVLNQWKSKKDKSKTYQKHGLQILSKPQLRVYN